MPEKVQPSAVIELSLALYTPPPFGAELPEKTQSSAVTMAALFSPPPTPMAELFEKVQLVRAATPPTPL